MAAVRCTAPTRGHVPGSQAQRECPVHGNRARTSPLPVSAAPIAPAPEHASKHKQTVLSDGTTVVEAWRKDGKLHRVDGPALVERYPDGTVIEQWYRNGKLHHEDGPAWVRRYPDGTVVERWYRNGKRHREDGPAWVERRPDGTVIEEWYRNNKRHREDGPTYIERHPDGTVVEWWYRNGVRHREDGPTYIERRPDGAVKPVKSWAWHLDGTRVEAWQVLGRHLLRQGTPELSAEALKQIAKDVPWQRWDELVSDHPLVALWSAVHPSAEIGAG